MAQALDDPAALRLVFDWIERLLQSDDEMIEYWTHVQAAGSDIRRAAVAQDYLEMSPSEAVINALYRSHPLDPSIVAALNPDADYEGIREQVGAMGPFRTVTKHPEMPPAGWLAGLVPHDATTLGPFRGLEGAIHPGAVSAPTQLHVDRRSASASSAADGRVRASSASTAAKRFAASAYRRS